ncbi:MAG: hypothetical protein WBE58_18965 [Verrucomicrobiales bacterium]
MNPITRSGAFNHRNISFCQTQEVVNGTVELAARDGDPKVVMDCHDCQQIFYTTPQLCCHPAASGRGGMVSSAELGRHRASQSAIDRDKETRHSSVFVAITMVETLGNPFVSCFAPWNK